MNRRGGRMETSTRKKDHHLTNSSLKDGVKAALRCVSIARYHLLLHLLVKTVHFVSQREDVAETEAGDTVGKQLVPVQGDKHTAC